MISRLIKLSVPVFVSILLCLPAVAQRILDEMQLVDISDEQSIRSTVIRDPEQALLVVKTQISSLRIQSNNVITKAEQLEPGTWHIRLVPGTHRLSFQAEGFISVQERFYFNPKDVKGVRIRVIPAAEKKEEKNTGIIVIKSTPDSAAVYLNDQFYGTTPYLGKTLAGQYKLELKLEPYLSHEQLIIIISGETLPVNVELSKDAGSVQISSSPDNARVELDDRYVGDTPLTFTKLSKGRHKIQVTLKDHEMFESEFEIDKEHRFQKFDISLKPKESKISIHGLPENAQVNIDDEKRGFIPFENTTIAYGSHKITVTKPGFFEFQKNIVVSSNDPLELNVTLKPKSKYSALLYSTFLPGSGQIYSGRKTPGIILGASALGCATVALIFTKDYNDKNDQYMISKEAYDINTDLGKMEELYQTKQDHYNEMEDAHKRSQVMWGLTIAVWLYNMADAVLFFPDVGGMELTANTKDRHTGLTLSVKF